MEYKNLTMVVTAIAVRICIYGCLWYNNVEYAHTLRAVSDWQLKYSMLRQENLWASCHLWYSWYGYAICFILEPSMMYWYEICSVNVPSLVCNINTCIWIYNCCNSNRMLSEISPQWEQFIKYILKSHSS